MAGALFELHQGVLSADGIHGLHMNGANRPILDGADALLHLHGFHDTDFVAGGYLLAGPNHDGDDPAGHGTAQGLVGGVAGGGVAVTRRRNDAGGPPALSRLTGSRPVGEAFHLNRDSLALNGDFNGESR